MKMKKILFVLMALCLASSLAFAAEEAATVAATTDTAAAVAPEVAAADMPAAAAAASEEMMVKGDIIDNMCAGANKDKIAEFVKTHTKECALQPACIESGYSIFADGKLYAFDKVSSAKVAEFLKQADSKLQVAITAKQVGDELSLVSIENQK
ncbi:MAG: hypothetical protein PHS66_08040 [Candidatus Omnitrophica bacterium]|nr:hypothetical protein [Candidatus Omnitrophota bacterium]